MAAPEMPYAPPNAPGRSAATARRFNCSSTSCMCCRSFATGRPVAPTERATGLRCVPLVVLSSATTPKCNVRICSSVYAYASQKSMLPQSCACASQKSMLPQSPSSSLLAHTSADTLCRCVCHGSAPFVGCDTRLGKRCRDAGSRVGDGQPPATQRVHDRGGGRPRARCPFDRLVFEGQARCPFDRLGLTAPCRSKMMCVSPTQCMAPALK